ncbi:concanavalin A-like lectin/glucanase domain-containing protein, partial [Spinellus fusiger]
STDHPCNRFGFKYTPCEPSSFAPMMYQQATHAHGTAVSITDKSSYVSVAKDGFTVTTDRGYRMCRANVGVQEGNWYWEAVVQKASNTPEGPHVRLGWARREACLNGPVGYDGYGYAYRDLTGDKVFCSRPTAFGASFEAGDVIGLYISLPPKSTVKSLTRKRIPIVYKDHLWFEEKDFRPSKEYQALADLPYPLRDAQHLNVIPGSYITVYKNGVCQGKMFEDLLDYEDFGSLPSMIQAGRKKRRKKQKKDKDVTGIRMRLEEDAFDGVRAQQWTEDPPLEDDGTLGYYPAVSVFQGGMVTCQFGPEFRYPPSPGEPWKPMSQRYDEYMAEECLWDVMDEVLRSLRRV